jgi:hypothetical protein
LYACLQELEPFAAAVAQQLALSHPCTPAPAMLLNGSAAAAKAHDKGITPARKCPRLSSDSSASSSRAKCEAAAAAAATAAIATTAGAAVATAAAAATATAAATTAASAAAGDDDDDCMIIEPVAVKTEPRTEPAVEAEPTAKAEVITATAAAASADTDTAAMSSSDGDAATDSEQPVGVKLESASDAVATAATGDAESTMCDTAAAAGTDDDDTAAADAAAAAAAADAAAAAAAVRARKAALSKLLPTSRSFHAEVEVTLTCPGCGYSRRLTEQYRDFSLDGVHALHAASAAAAASAAGSGGALPLAALVQRFFLPRRLALRCEKCGCERVKAQHKLAALPC